MIYAVICPHHGKTYDTLNTPYHTRNATKPTASDKIHKSEATIESAGLAPSSESLKQCVQFTLDATRRKGLPRLIEPSGASDH